MLRFLATTIVLVCPSWGLVPSFIPFLSSERVLICQSMSNCHRMRQRPQYRPQMQMLWKGPRQRTLIATAATSATHESDDSSSSSSASSSPHASVGSAPTGDVKATPREPGAYEKFVQDTLRYLAELSLKDYQWRADIFKAKEAERMMEQSLARVRGNDPNYVRPMDADDQTIGPLGRWEKSSVDWLFQVIEEEARRAEQIVQSAGKLIRPKDAGDEYGLGPLGFLEKRASDFIRSIQIAEKERVRSNILRPKDLDESLRGPLGEAEWQAIQVFQAIEESEKLRLNQSRLRGGELVRPIDVPGPLGEFEMAVLDVFDSEQKRAKERQQGSGVLVRPKDARIPGRLGEYEKQAVEAIKKLNDEEKKRLESIRRILRENRPMEYDKGSFLGMVETIVVGVVRAPIMLVSVVKRVVELLTSEKLSEADQEILRQQQAKSSDESGKGMK